MANMRETPVSERSPPESSEMFSSFLPGGCAMTSIPDQSLRRSDGLGGRLRKAAENV
jgi:hypothetical protein